MTMLRSGCLPGSLAKTCVRICFCLALLNLSACASRQAQHRTTPQYVLAPARAQVAGYRKVARPVELEDDGLEEQAAPPRRFRDEPDDPSEPFSPNYGAGRVVSDASDQGDDSDFGGNPDSYDPFLDDPAFDRDGV